MATGTGLPELKGGGPVLAQAPSGVNADTLFNAQSWSQIAAAGDKLGDAAFASLKVTDHQTKMGSLAESDVNDRRKRIELQDQFPDDPGAFQREWQGYTEGKLTEAAPWAVSHIRTSLGSEGNAAYASILSTRRQKIEVDTKRNWTAQEDVAANDVTGAAMSGTLIPGGPDGTILDPRILKYQSVVESGVTSQLIPRDEANRRLASLQSRATVYASREEVQKVFSNPDGGPIAAIKRIDEIVRNPKLSLSDDERIGLGTRLRADVHAWDAERTQNLSTVDLRAKTLLRANQLGERLPESEINDVVDQYTRFGGQAQAATFLGDVGLITKTSWIARAPLADSGAWLEQLRTQRGFASPPDAAKTVMNAYIKAGYSPAAAAAAAGSFFHESGLNPNATHDPDPETGRPTGLGIAGWRLDRLEGLKRFAAGRGTSANDFQTQVDFSIHELGTTEGKAGAALRAAQTPEDAAAAFIHFERPQGYDPADLTKSHGYANRLGLAVKFAGGKMPVAASDVTLIAQTSKVLADRVSSEADAIIKGMDDKTNPVLPTSTRMTELVSAAAASGSNETLEKVSRAALEYQWRRDFGQKPLAAQIGFVSDLHSKAVREGLSTTDARLLQIAIETRDLTQQRLDADPLAHTTSALSEVSQLPPLKPLETRNSASLQAGLQERARWAALGTRTFDRFSDPMPALTAAETTQMRNVLDASDPAGKARIYRDINTLPAETRNATLSRLGSKGGADMIEAFAGALFNADSDVGESIIRGQSAMKASESFNPMKEGNRSATLEKLDKYLPPELFTVGARTAPQGAYATMRGAVVARVADLVATNPAHGADFPDALFERAVKDVTGGTVFHNGAMTIAPIRGMSQKQFEARMLGIDNLDVYGVTTPSGQPVTADYIRDNAQLESVADGKYLLRLGRNPDQPIYAFRDVGANIPGQRLRPFVLDLRRVTPAAPVRIDPLSLSTPQP